MTEEELDLRYLAACAIAREAGDLARLLYETRKPGTYSLKGAQDYLTEADGAVERLILERLRASFPRDSVVAEESGGEIGPLCWVIDPIDGTANFARGIDHFCVSIGLVEDRRVMVGAIAAPAEGDFYAARRGHGATRNGVRMAVSPVNDMALARVELGWSPRRPAEAWLAMARAVLGAGASFARGGSGSLGLAYVAAGRNDGYAELFIHSWDVAAALLMVEEAGGWVSDFFAGDGFARGNPVLAAAPGIASELRRLTGIGAGP